MGKCLNCKYKGSVPGSSHSTCSKKNILVDAKEHGIRMGWFNFPYDFDPTWLNKCSGFVDKNFSFKDASLEELLKIVMLQHKVMVSRSDRSMMEGSEIEKSLLFLEDFKKIITLMNNVGLDLTEDNIGDFAKLAFKTNEDKNLLIKSAISVSKL